jgi:hypothetical protein
MSAADGMFLGDLQRRVAKLESLVTMLASGRRMESASIGAGGTRYHSGGSSTYEGGGGINIFDGGHQFVQGGKITAADPEGDLVFEVDAGESPSIFMRQELIRQLSLEIFAARIHSDFDPDIAQRNSDVFGNPTNGAAVGPAVTDVEILTGSALIMISAGVEFSTSNAAANSTPRVAGVVGVEISGATSIAPDEEVGLSAQSFKSRSGGAVTTVDGIVNVTTISSFHLQTGLTPGLHDFTLKYRKWLPSTDYVNVDARSLTVIAF